MIEWTPHHSYCCQVLQEAGQVNDLRLVRIVQVLKLAQDVSRTFCYDTHPKSTLLPTHGPPISNTSSRIIRSLGLSHCQRLPPTTRNLARPKPHPRRVRILLVPPHNHLPARSISPLLPQCRRPPPAVWFQRPRRINPTNFRPARLCRPCRLYIQNRLFRTKVPRCIRQDALSG